MGDFKPLLPLGNGVVIEQVVATLQGAGIGDIRVVLGYRSQDVIPVLKDLGISWVINEEFQTEMLGSVKVGVHGLSPDSEAFFVLPVDIPLVRPQTFQTLVDVFSKDKPHIVYPTFLGQRGHPPLIPRQYAGELMQWGGNGGLKSFLEQYDPISFDVPVFDESILMDMDTPEHYGQVVARYGSRDIPSKAECLAIMASRFSADHPVLKHSRVVARVARILGEKIAHTGCKMNVNLVEACGYLHDIGKGQKRHAKVGAQLLKNMGYPNIADIIAVHIDLSFVDEGKITEKEVIYLADKLTQGESVLELEKRLESKLNQLADNSEGQMAAEKRIRTAMQIQHAIEKIIGENINDLIAL
jgi:molybdenum cofactor cytidylyltransferase